MTDLETAAVGCRSCGEMGFILAPTKAEPNIERQFLCPTCAHTAEKIRAAREAERERCTGICKARAERWERKATTESYREESIAASDRSTEAEAIADLIREPTP